MKSNCFNWILSMILSCAMVTCFSNKAMEIKPIEPHHIDRARSIIIDTAFEFKIIDCNSRTELERDFERNR